MLTPEGLWAATDAEVADRLHPLYSGAITRAPRGELVTRGLPFRLAGQGEPLRWLMVDRSVDLDLDGTPATHLVTLAFCDAWRDATGERPIGAPPGWVLPVGEPLASLRVHLDDAPPVKVTLRRRFEVNDGIVGWGCMAFLAVPHHVESPLDWRGPHGRLPVGRFAEPGQTGPLTVLPGGWAVSQTGVEDHVPSPTDDLTLWLHAVEVAPAGRPRRLTGLTLEPLPGQGQGRLVVVAALTAFAGDASPLRWSPRRSLALDGAAGRAVDVDLGMVARRRFIPVIAAERPPVVGWGVSPSGASQTEEVEIVAAEDALLLVDGEALPLPREDPSRNAAMAGSLRVRALPACDRRLSLELVDAQGRRTPGRVRLVTSDGRYVPPLGHRSEVNFGLAEDLGADILLGGAEYAYVDGQFEADVPAEGFDLEVLAGMHRAPLYRQVSDADVAGGVLRLELADPLRPREGRWVTGDTHVHFLSPVTALLQARAEGVNAVHLLATQWGDHHTNITDLGGDQTDPAGEHAVWVGSENRQNMLGHIGIVGTRRPVLPFASGGPPEGPIGGPVTHLMADWLTRCRDEGGLAIGAHFPLPMAEVASDIAWGLLDALELETMDLTLEYPPLREWYRYLDAGYRLPLVAGTDKMTASVPLGQVRTWARLDDDAALTFGSWAAAIRAGRTFATSGPLLEMSVEGQGPGADLQVSAGATLDVELVARAAQPIVSAVELVLDGTVVAAVGSDAPVTELILRERVSVEHSGWLAGRSRSPYVIGSAFATAMAAHTSPVYVEVPGRPRPRPDMSTPLALVDGTRAWLEALAPVRGAADRERFRRFLDESERRLRERGS